MSSAMPMMPCMILMAKTCKEAVCVSNWQGTHVTDVEADLVAAAAEVVMAAAVDADPVETHQDQGPITAWSWRTCPQGLLGR